MCNRARNIKEAPTIFAHFESDWKADRPMDNRFNPVELAPRSRAWVVRQDERGCGLDVMSWDVLGGQAKFPMTNVRQLGLPHRIQRATSSAASAEVHSRQAGLSRNCAARRVQPLTQGPISYTGLIPVTRSTCIRYGARCFESQTPISSSKSALAKRQPKRAVFASYQQAIQTSTASSIVEESECGSQTALDRSGRDRSASRRRRDGVESIAKILDGGLNGSGGKGVGAVDAPADRVRDGSGLAFVGPRLANQFGMLPLDLGGHLGFTGLFAAVPDREDRGDDRQHDDPADDDAGASHAGSPVKQIARSRARRLTSPCTTRPPAILNSAKRSHPARHCPAFQSLAMLDLQNPAVPML